MAHVFRLHAGGDQNIKGWADSRQYGKNEVNSIADPSGATAELPITSVPTPFASLELARSAFSLCGSVDKNGKNNIFGSTIYHKIVSFCLDTLEIFFNFNKFADDFEIIAWNAQDDIAALMQSTEEEHRKLAQTLSLYMKQDAKAFNFSTGTVFYLLNYVKGPAPLNIVGGTSPTSLAVASTNDLSYVSVPLSANHNAFDSDPLTFRSLAERDYAFIKYVWVLTLQPQFSKVYPDIYKYVQECFRCINDLQLKEELRNMLPTGIDNYTPLMSGAAMVALPGGIVLGTCPIPNPEATSDFVIRSDYQADGHLPLVLPSEAGYNDAAMRYVTGPWNPAVKAPFYDPADINHRRLPGDNTEYPYLTVDDVLQPYIIKTVFPIEKRSYFLGNYAGNAGFSCLLPLKKEIFKYLSIDTICGTTQGAHALPLMEMKDIAGKGVEVVVRIPVQKGRYITMRRRYFDIDDEPNLRDNRGVIVKCTFDMYLFPSYHLGAGTNGLAAPQRVYLADGDNMEATCNFDYTVEAYKAQAGFGKNLIRSVVKKAVKNENASFSSKIFVADEEFDIVCLSNGFAEGMLIPRYLQVVQGSDSYHFAIDFGTTNTHVEYRVNGGNSVSPLEMTSSESAVIAMHPVDDAFEKKLWDLHLNAFVDATYQEFMPTTFGNDDVAAFPLRTNICMSAAATDHDSLRAKAALADYAIGFNYEKTNTYRYNRTITNLKWLGDGTQHQYVSSFFEELLMLIRSKILLGGGSLKKTKITWFYPVSMETFRRSQLANEWTRLCHAYIDAQCVILSVTESLAPFYYYKNVEGVNAAYRPVVSMDIGGGTTDFAVYENNKAVLISSVRFAGNSVYGDFPGFGFGTNGFVNRYRSQFDELIAKAKLSTLTSAYNNIIENASSADFVSFLYSLERNADLKRRGLSISFSDTLRNDYSMKTLLLLFYVGEMYYLAHILKAKGIATPEFLTISGTGSKLLYLIGGQGELEKLAKIVFNDVVGDEGNVYLKQVENPKEITCKGGLLMKDSDVVGDSDGLRYWFAASEDIESKGVNVRVKDVDEAAVSEVVDFYERFIDYFFGLNARFSFEKNFGIDTQKSFADYRNLLLEHAHEDTAAMLEKRKSESNDPETELEDSMFFFPLAGGLNRLAAFISNQKD